MLAGRKVLGGGGARVRREVVQRGDVLGAGVGGDINGRGVGRVRRSQ